MIKNYEQKEKVRALVITEDSKIVIANYGGVTLLPGGSLESKENKEEALIRELEEELGIIYERNELKYFMTLIIDQPNYPNIDGTVTNRKLITHYYITHFKGIHIDQQKLTEGEKTQNFYLEILTIEEIKQKIKKINENPRSIYFNEELNTVLENYLNQTQKEKNKTYKIKKST